MSLIAFLVVGELLIWLGQNMALPKKIWSRSSFLTELFKCDICLGFWVYLALCPLFRVTIIPSSTLPEIIMAYLITAAVSAFAAHIFMVGLRTEFGTTVVE